MYSVRLVWTTAWSDPEMARGVGHDGILRWAVEAVLPFVEERFSTLARTVK